MAVAALLAACGGESSSDANEPSGTYRVHVSEASFPTKQRLGQTSLLQLGVRNSGKKTIPALTVTITIAGRAGRTSALPFGVRDPQPDLAQSDRPVWVLAETYPRLVGSSEPGGATTSNRKTFSFGPLKPGKTVAAVWKLSAVKAGQLHPALPDRRRAHGGIKAETDGGVPPGGSFVTEITQQLPETEVTDSGEVVEIPQPRSGAGKGGE